jgi:Na+/H+ antiporter NhaD/arsenite permease-like protein
VETWVAAAVFLITYGLITTDRIDKTIVALLGGLMMVVLGVLDQAEAFAGIDFNVIFLLAGMMALAGILRRTGFFQWLAIVSAKTARGDPVRLLILLSLVTAVVSAFLDNVTTVVLIAPVTLYVAGVLGVSPIPYLLGEIFASNIGGTATLIGDPPNILIGSASGLDFGAFIVNLTPPNVVILIVVLATLRFMFRRELVLDPSRRDAVLALDERQVLTDPRLLRVSLAVIAVTMVGFLFHGAIGLEPATIALFGATLLMLLSRIHPEEVLREIEWPTLFFFIGLFMLVEGIVHVGILEAIGRELIELTRGQETILTVSLLWISGAISAIVDNIPYTATMIPVVQQLGDSGMRIEPLWWALALGACLGGNATIVGASANVVVSNLSARAGHPIRFGQFLRYGIVVVLESMVLSSIYLWWRYLM